MNFYWNILWREHYNLFFNIKILFKNKFNLFLNSFTFKSLYENLFESFINFNNLFFFKRRNTKNLHLLNLKRKVLIYEKSLVNFNYLSFIIKESYWYNYIKNNYFIYSIYNYFNSNRKYLISFLLNIFFLIKNNSIKILFFLKKTFGDGFIYIRGLFIIFFVDACITDDEPLWEPLEWSLVQTWIFFIFIFAWIAENLITSRYGSYTGRDKRVWFAWYKTFWFLEFFYALTYGTAAMFVIVPFYYELTYQVSFIFSWWNWYTRVFFFKFVSVYTIVLFISYLFQLNLRWLNWKKNFLFVLIINIFIAYLLYINFIISFFAYFTDPIWYQKTRFIDYIQLSHEPLKWGWGPSKRDHFTYHKVSTVFWFKNDGPFAGAFLMFHLFFFLSTFFLYIYWITLLRRIYVTKEVTFTFATYCVSSLRQFFYFFFLFYLLIVISFIINYWRFPIEFLWIINSHSWFIHFFMIIKDYYQLLLFIIF